MTKLLELILRMISRLHLGILYGIADVLFVLSYFLFRGGRKVTLRNLTRSFPDLNRRAIDRVARRSARHTVSILIEMVKAMTISDTEIRRRMKFRNPEVIHRYHEDNKSVLILASHHCNWEWLLLSLSLSYKVKFDALYEPLNISVFDSILKEVRSRFGANLVSAKGGIKGLIKTDANVRMVGIVGDQGPGLEERKYWAQFLNQDTPFFQSIQSIATLLRYPVVFARVIRVRRGYYEVTLEEIASPPYGKDTQVIDAFIDALESHIREYPTEWLWAYRRWKYDRSVDDVQHRRHRLQK